MPSRQGDRPNPGFVRYSRFANLDRFMVLNLTCSCLTRRVAPVCLWGNGKRIGQTSEDSYSLGVKTVWVHYFDILVAIEILHVDSENLANPMHLHGCEEAGV